jgi:single-strand DNA-binding protein
MNITMLVGRLTKDSELRFTENEKKVGNFTLAINRDYKNTNGEYETDFINCVVFGEQAETLNKYTQKGDLIGVQGRLQTRNYEDKEGKKHYITEVLVNKVQFLSTKNSQKNENNVESSDPYVEMGNKVAFDEDSLPF